MGVDPIGVDEITQVGEYSVRVMSVNTSTLTSAHLAILFQDNHHSTFCHYEVDYFEYLT